jgi:hypothetical protein
MRTLFAEQYAPITSRIGFIEYPIDELVELLAAWRRGLDTNPVVADVTADGFPYAFHRLEPLTIPGYPRELLVECGSWTAYFDNGLFGTDPIGPIIYLTGLAQVRGLAIATVPETGRRLGGVKWELFADHRTHFLNYQRTVALVHDSTRWVFETSGEPEPYEDLERYKARRVRDRFDSGLVEQYSQAIGIDVFNKDAYGPSAVLIESTNEVPPGTRVLSMTLDEAQRDQGIVPGRADALPG